MCEEHGNAQGASPAQERVTTGSTHSPCKAALGYANEAYRYTKHTAKTSQNAAPAGCWGTKCTLQPATWSLSSYPVVFCCSTIVLTTCTRKAATFRRGRRGGRGGRWRRGGRGGRGKWCDRARECKERLCHTVKKRETKTESKSKSVEIFFIYLTILSHIIIIIYQHDLRVEYFIIISG
jgi:hypothetical protein